MNEQYENEWRRIHEQKRDTLNWFKEARYGMFIHWGLYSMLGGVYKGKKMEEGRPPRVAEWIMHAHKIPRDEYRGLAKRFNPVEFDAAEWVSLAKAAGMRYMVITSKHHDGFALFDSDVSSLNIKDATPFGRDVVAELHAECRRQGLAFGLYYSHSIDWMEGGDGGQKDYSAASGLKIGLHAYNDWDPAPVSFDEYIEKKSLPQVREILSKYPGIKILWCDVAYHIPEKHSREFYRLAHEVSPETIICQRIGNGYGDYEIPGDNIIPDAGEEHEKLWETVGTMNNSWGYKSYDHDWKSPAEVLFWIVEIVSKGGNYMLNVGPTGSGRIPNESAEILKTVGAWLHRHESAVYGTDAWEVNHEGPTVISMKGTSSREDQGFKAQFTAEDFWFTARGKDVFAFSMVRRLPDKVRINSLAGEAVSKVTHVGSKTACEFTRTPEGLAIETAGIEPDELGHVFRVECR